MQILGFEGAVSIARTQFMEARIKTFVLETIGQSRERWTTQALRKVIAVNFGLTARQSGKVIDSLVNSGELTYTYLMGHSFLEISFNRPVRISNRVVLKPPALSYAARPGEVVIDLKAGASFGMGAHPTTQLAVKGIEYALESTNCCQGDTNTRVLDIGIGSGVLALTALKLGIRTGMGTDIDACARFEAKENCRLNGLLDRVTISDRSIDDLKDTYNLISANLRFPTLNSLIPDFGRLLKARGVVVMTGFTAEERPQMSARSRDYEFEPIWYTEDRQWAAMVIKKRRQDEPTGAENDTI